MPIPDRNAFQEAYQGRPPWDIDGPQGRFVQAANQIVGSVLDAGCGTGENALFFAERGHAVTGIDFLPEPIERAKAKAQQRGVAVTFLVKDALELPTLDQAFDTAIDSGLFHVFSDADRRRYIEGLAAVLKPGGRLLLLCFSDAEPGTHGPRRVPRQEIEAGFARGWQIESIEPARFDVRPDLKDIQFSPGGPKAWFATVRRQ